MRCATRRAKGASQARKACGGVKRCNERTYRKASRFAECVDMRADLLHSSRRVSLSQAVNHGQAESGKSLDSLLEVAGIQHRQRKTMGLMRLD